MPSSYDQLSGKEQALVRTEWAEGIEDRLAALDLAGEFAAQGRSWVELDDKGKVIERDPAEADLLRQRASGSNSTSGTEPGPN